MSTLGANQVAWMRRNVRPFRDAEAVALEIAREQELYRTAYGPQLEERRAEQDRITLARRAMVADVPALSISRVRLLLGETPDRQIPLWVQGLAFGAAMAVIVYGLMLMP